MQGKSSQKFIANPFQDISQEKYKAQKDSFDSLIRSNLQKLQKQFEQKIQSSSLIAQCSYEKNIKQDFSLYKGAGGHFVAYHRMYQFHNGKQDQKQAQYYKDCCLKSFSVIDKFIQEDKNLQKPKPMVSYYFGPPGFYMTASEFFYEIKDLVQFQYCVDEVQKYAGYIMGNLNSQNLNQEVLYGIPGYLYCILKLQKLFQNAQVQQEYQLNLSGDALKVMDAIWQFGIMNYEKISVKEVLQGKKLPEDFRLVYQFHNKEYVGGAHGLWGVINILLMAYYINGVKMEAKMLKPYLSTLQASVDFLLKSQVESGNFPSSLQSSKKGSSLLCQFCHGSPGAINPLLLAAKIFGEQKYLNAALLAGENIWHNGIIKKGFGLCHGISGNGYGFLALYNRTKDEKWIFRAQQFGGIWDNEKIMGIINSYELQDRYTIGKPDFPYSLMQGIAGDIIFLIDILDPTHSSFPGYTIQF